MALTTCQTLPHPPDESECTTKGMRGGCGLEEVLTLVLGPRWLRGAVEGGVPCSSPAPQGEGGAKRPQCLYVAGDSEHVWFVCTRTNRKAWATVNASEVYPVQAMLLHLPPHPALVGPCVPIQRAPHLRTAVGGLFVHWPHPHPVPFLFACWLSPTRVGGQALACQAQTASCPSEWSCCW